jgi:hypothetical protein
MTDLAAYLETLGWGIVIGAILTDGMTRWLTRTDARRERRAGS